MPQAACSGTQGQDPGAECFRGRLQLRTQVALLTPRPPPVILNALEWKKQSCTVNLSHAKFDSVPCWWFRKAAGSCAPIQQVTGRLTRGLIGRKSSLRRCHTNLL